MPRKSSVAIEVTAEERYELRALRRELGKKRNWVRAEIVLRAAGGQTNYIIAKQLGISRNTVQQWRYRFARERLAGLRTRPIPGRPPRSKAESNPIGQQPVAQMPLEHQTIEQTHV